MKPACFPPHRSFAACCLLLAAGLFLANVSARAFTPASYNDPDTNSAYWPAINADASTLESRSCAQYVLEEYAKIAASSTPNTVSSTSATQIITALCRLQSMQDVTKGDTYYGNFAWEQSAVVNGVVNVYDPNAVEFVVQALAQVPIRYASLENQTTGTPNYGSNPPSYSATTLINQMLGLAGGAVINQSVSYSYTNMAVTKAWNLIALGQLYPTDPNNYASQGRGFFYNWYADTQATGINEFLSPTYTAGDMDSLGFIYLYATDQEIRSSAQQALHLFWTDLYANWMNQNQHMGGSHSRTYDFLLETGSTDRYYCQAGLLTSRTPSFWRGMNVINMQIDVPSDIPALSYGYPLTMLRCFDRNWSPGNVPNNATVMQFATTYVNAAPGGNNAFSVGSLSTFYNDVTAEGLTITVPPGSTNGVDTPVINFNTEGMGDPYLDDPTDNEAGVPKADTLRPFLASVQRGPEVLFVASSDGLDRSNSTYDTATWGMESSLVFPSDASVYIGNGSNPTSISSTGYVLNVGSTFFIVETNASTGVSVATGVRILQATNFSLTNPKTHFIALYADGSAQGAANASRLTVVHTDHAMGTDNTGRGTVALWTRTQQVAGTGAPGNFAAFQSAFYNAAVTTNTYTNNVASITVQGLQGALTVNADCGKEKFTSGSGGEPNLTSALLNIGGTEYVTQTLQDWTGADIGGPSPAGSSTEDGTGLFTVTGGGPDIWGAADQFHFVYQTLKGDGYIVAHLDNLPPNGQPTPNGWAKAGVMIRNTLDANSANGIMYQTPNPTGGNGWRFSYRQAAGNSLSVRGNTVNMKTQPVWLKVVRTGSTASGGGTLAGYTSTDGVTWQQQYNSISIPTLNPTVFVGLAVTSYVSGTPVTATFDNVGVFQQ